MPTLTLAGHRRATPEQVDETPAVRHTRRARVLGSLLPEPSPEHLVPVTDVPRVMVPFAEEHLADVEIGAVVQEIPAMNGHTRFRVLVTARDREVAEEVLAGL
jgi:hypothetical protein